MSPRNRISRFLPALLNPMPLDVSAGFYRDLRGTRKPRRQESFTNRMILDAYFREWPEEGNQPGRPSELDPLTIPDYQSPPTEEDLRIHAWLTERLAALHRERHGLWPRLMRFFRAIARMAGGR